MLQEDVLAVARGREQHVVDAVDVQILDEGQKSELAEAAKDAHVEERV